MDAILQGRAILIVEDEPLIALEIRRCFEAAGAKVVHARSLQAALDAIENATPTAAVVDHSLPDGDSSEICERLKERNIPFIVHSGYSQLDGACADGVQVGKPADPQALVTTVEGLLRSHPAEYAWRMCAPTVF
jgi:DNA-binding response OmpR family regulator